MEGRRRKRVAMAKSRSGIANERIYTFFDKEKGYEVRVIRERRI